MWVRHIRCYSRRVTDMGPEASSDIREPRRPAGVLDLVAALQQLDESIVGNAVFFHISRRNPTLPPLPFAESSGGPILNSAPMGESRPESRSPDVGLCQLIHYCR